MKNPRLLATRAALIAATCVALTACDRPNPTAPLPSQTAAPAAATPPAPIAPVALQGTPPAPLLNTQSVAVGGTCVVDLINKTKPEAITSVKRSDAVELIGWAGAVGPAGFTTIRTIELVGINTQTHWYAATLTIPRADVATHMKEPAFAGAGYTQLLNANALLPDDYRVRLVLQNSSDALVCDSGKVLRVMP